MPARAIKALLVLGSPIYLLMAGPFGLLAVPVMAMVVGPSLWPNMARGRLLLLGVTTIGTMLVVYALAVFWFYGLGAPTGAWAWLGPGVALVVYCGGCPAAYRRPWAWPLVAGGALLSMAAVGAIAMLIGVRFES